MRRGGPLRWYVFAGRRFASGADGFCVRHGASRNSAERLDKSGASFSAALKARKFVVVSSWTTVRRWLLTMLAILIGNSQWAPSETDDHAHTHEIWRECYIEPCSLSDTCSESIGIFVTAVDAVDILARDVT